VAAFTETSGNGRGLTIHGDGAQERDFVHVEDLVDALLLVGVHGRNGIWNVSAGESTSVLELAKTHRTDRRARARRQAWTPAAG